MDKNCRSLTAGTNEFAEFCIPPDEDLIFQVVRSDDIATLKHLLETGTSPNCVYIGEHPYILKSDKPDGHCLRLIKYSPLHVAAIHSNIKTIKHLLSHGADMEITDGNKQSSLYLASAACRQDIVEFLCDKGADVNRHSSNRQTPLMQAVLYNHAGIVEKLIAAGADLDRVDVAGCSALFLAVLNKIKNRHIIQNIIQSGCDDTPLVLSVAASPNYRDDVFDMLISAGAGINQVDRKGKTAVHYVINDHDSSRLHWLVQNGADVNIPDITGQAPLLRAENIEIIHLLLEAECYRDLDVVALPRIKRLCSYHPEFKQWLHNEFSVPRSLRRLCRYAIRCSLSPNKLTAVVDLPLPDALKDYLLLKTTDL